MHSLYGVAQAAKTLKKSHIVGPLIINLYESAKALILTEGHVYSQETRRNLLLEAREAKANFIEVKTLFDNVSEDQINTQLKIIEDQIESTQHDSFIGLLQRQQLMNNLEQISAIKQLKGSFNPLPEVDKVLNLIHSPRKEVTLFNIPFDQVLTEF